jgi:hypothetical protein
MMALISNATSAATGRHDFAALKVKKPEMLFLYKTCKTFIAEVSSSILG